MMNFIQVIEKGRDRPNGYILVVEISLNFNLYIWKKSFSVGTMAAWICICLPWNILLNFPFSLGLVLQLINRYVCSDGKLFSTGELGTKADQVIEHCCVHHFISLSH